MDFKDLSRSKAEQDKRKYHKVPKDIERIQRQRERDRLWKAAAWFAAYVVLFIVGVLTPGAVGLLLTTVAFACSAASNVYLYGAHEKLLRKVAHRPAVDYPKLAKLEKRERRERKALGGTQAG